MWDNEISLVIRGIRPSETERRRKTSVDDAIQRTISSDDGSDSSLLRRHSKGKACPSSFILCCLIFIFIIIIIFTEASQREIYHYYFFSQGEGKLNLKTWSWCAHLIRLLHVFLDTRSNLYRRRPRSPKCWALRYAVFFLNPSFITRFDASLYLWSGHYPTVQSGIEIGWLAPFLNIEGDARTLSIGRF